jgi:hypothetical protein
MQTVLNDAQSAVKVTIATKVVENVSHAKMDTTAISVITHALGTVKENAEDLQVYVVHAGRDFTVVAVILHVLNIAWKATVLEMESATHVNQDTGGISAMKNVLTIVPNARKLITSVLHVKMGGLVNNVPRNALLSVEEMAPVKARQVNAMSVPLDILAVSVSRHAVHIAM